jgi:hypothetical protein
VRFLFVVQFSVPKDEDGKKRKRNKTERRKRKIEKSKFSKPKRSRDYHQTLNGTTSPAPH